MGLTNGAQCDGVHAFRNMTSDFFLSLFYFPVYLRLWRCGIEWILEQLDLHGGWS